MNTFIKTTSFFLLLLVLSAATSVFAANIFFDTKNQSFAQGEEFLVQVFLNTEGEFVNAIEGKIVFPADLLEAKEIRDGNSSINFWIEKPHSFQLGVITFSGITPGGLLGQKELLLSVVFRAKKEGSGAIQTDGLRVLRNDGEGTPASIKVSPLQFSISQKSSSISPIIESIKDAEPPEDFKPTIENDPSIFDGKYFLVFVTQDKGSGIDHYEIREGKKPFVVAESPYLLQNQNLDKEIAVKAVDKNGNERVINLPPQKPLPWYKNYTILAILIIIGLIIAGVILRKILWQKFIKSR